MVDRTPRTTPPGGHGRARVVARFTDGRQAVLLREVSGFTNREAAKMMGLSDSVFRQHLGKGRRAMIEAFGEHCALIHRGGICHMCTVLRSKLPEELRGEPLARIGEPDDSPDALLDARLAITREAALVEGSSSAWHDLMFRWMSAQEEAPAPA